MSLHAELLKSNRILGELIYSQDACGFWAVLLSRAGELCRRVFPLLKVPQVLLQGKI